MQVFQGIQFRGVFRSYQQGVLDQLDTHLTDNKIHIVAAPGSGKTVLGLELIRRLGSPALVLSPTVTIQHQWSQRFEEMFLPVGEAVGEYLSLDLHTPRRITSITYQGLYAAWNRLCLREENGEINYSDLDLLDCIRRHNIGTICLDEAHHLKAGWQSALEGLLHAVGKEVTVISLTATPPYDSTPAEWSRYRALCGEVDAEISVPELVWQGDLCPHQDFILFSHPTSDETKSALARYQQVQTCLDSILKESFFAQAVRSSGLLETGVEQEEWRWSNPGGASALICLAHRAGMEIPHKIRDEMFPRGHIPRANLELSRQGLQFMLDNSGRMGEETVAQLLVKLSTAGLILRRRVCLTLDQRQETRLTASRGKLGSIRTIARAELENLGNALRMVVLTDRIDRELLPLVGSGSPVEDLGAVPVFEAVRQAVGEGVSMAVLTGTLVLVPTELLHQARREARERHISFGERPLSTSRYTELTFSGHNRGKVELITALFQQGALQIVVGTKALLGEGWDAPCINSLVLASFVGSFVQSNQMRGRAIRRDRDTPKKVANIWHLATVLPPELFDTDFTCSDYSNIVRRFACFLAPSYGGETVESGIQRLEVIHGQFDAAGIGRINKDMLSLAADRQRTARHWGGELTNMEHPHILDVADIPFSAAPPRFLFFNVLRLSGLTSVLVALVGLISQLPVLASTWLGYVLAAGFSLAAMGLLYNAYRGVLRLLSPSKFIRAMAQALLETLRELGEIKSPDAGLLVQADPWGIGVECALQGGTLQEKRLYNKAVSELLSPFESPRYLLIRQQRLGKAKDYSRSFACPAVIANHRKRVDMLAAQLHRERLSLSVLYTGGQPGRQMLLQALRKSYINRNAVHIQNKRIARRDNTGAAAAGKVKERMKNATRDLLWGLLRRLSGG